MRAFEFGLWLCFTVAGVHGQQLAKAATPTVLLNQTVEVNRATILLSDFLPGEASPALRAAAGLIELARSPQPGTLRILEAGQIVQRLAAYPELLRQVSVPARITVCRYGWPIESAAVERALANFLRQQGWKESDLPRADGLTWPDGIAALTPNPDLEVSSADWDSGRQVFEFRVRCLQRADCGVFLVKTHAATGAITAKSRPLRLVRSLSSGPPNLRSNPELPGGATPARMILAKQSTAAPAIAKPGDAAILIMEGRGIRISLPVICLERGGLWQKIRARDSANHRIFHAEVVGAGLLRTVF